MCIKDQVDCHSLKQNVALLYTSCADKHAVHLSKGTNACLPDMPSYNKHAVHLSKGTGAKHRCYTSTASSTRSMYIQPIWPYSIFKPNLIEGLSNQLVRPLRKPYLSTNIMLLQCIGCNKVSKLCMQQRAREMILKMRTARRRELNFVDPRWCSRPRK